MSKPNQPANLFARSNFSRLEFLAEVSRPGCEHFLERLY